MVRKQLGGKVDMKHFRPDYNPWDQRLCVVPNGDLFRALRKGEASMVTDHIERFTETGIRLKSGATLEADIIITATGLNVQMLGGATLEVDGKPIAISEHLSYKGVMLESVPNFGVIFGYTNASWTLKADIASEYLCRLIKYMDRKGYRSAVARDVDGCNTEDTVLGGLNSGYIRRAIDKLPQQGSKAPWQIRQDYVRDVPILRLGAIEDDILSFDGRPPRRGSLARRVSGSLQAAMGRA